MLMLALSFAEVWPALLAVWPIPVAGLVIAGLIRYVEWLKDNKPESMYPKYMGWVVQAVKHAEAAIKDGTPNKSLAKADAFAKKFIELYELYTGKTASESLKIWAMNMKELVLLQMEKNKAKALPPAAPEVVPPVGTSGEPGDGN